MRVIIEGSDTIAVETSRPSIEAPEEVMHLFIDAGPAPIEMLRRIGQVPPTTDLDVRPSKEEIEAIASTSSKSTSGKHSPAATREAPLNPLRAGAAAARVGRKTKPKLRAEGPENIDTIDAGSAPKIGRQKKKS